MSNNTPEAQALKNIHDVLSDQAGEIEIPSFWQMELKPNPNGENTPVQVNFPDSAYLTLTNICLPETTLNGQPVTDPVRVFAINNTQETKTLIASLLPGKSEHEMINILFSPINDISLELQGKLPVHIVGVITPFDDPLDYEEEEEEEEEANEK